MVSRNMDRLIFYCRQEQMCILCYLSVQHFMSVFQEVHEEDPKLFGAGTRVMMDAQCFCGSHLESPSQKNSEFSVN